MQDTAVRSVTQSLALIELQRAVLAHPIDARRVALTKQGTIVLTGQEAQEVSNARQDRLGRRLGDLADRTQWMRDWAHSPRVGFDPVLAVDEYIGDAFYLGETWAVYALISRRSPVVRYVGRPIVIAAVSA